MISQIDIEDYIKELDEKEMTTIQGDQQKLIRLMAMEREETKKAEDTIIAGSINFVVDQCFSRAYKNGWHTNLETGEELYRPIPELLCLIHSEISEALEGYRKNLMDDHLPQYPMLGVELADAVIRICDLAGRYKIPLGAMVRDKLNYNDDRADHKPENRRKDGGKKI